MLPRSNRSWISNRNRAVILQGIYDIWDDPILRPIAPTNYIPCTGTGNNFFVRRKILGVKKRAPITANNQFSTRFACTVWIVAAEAVCFTIRIMPFLIFINLVGGNTNNSTLLFELTHSV